jgi:hypothetical protein
MLREKKHVKFDQKKDDFVKPELFHGMYNKIYYTKQVHTGISVIHDKASSYDLQGNVVDDDDPASFGIPTRFQCLHPEKVIMVDETGNSTNQVKNGHRGGQKFLTTRKGKTRERYSTKYYHFTVLPFVEATGEPVMCAVVVAKKGPLTMEEIIGLNAMAQLDEQDELDMEDIDDKFCDVKDKVFPYGPTVTYNGKKVPCYVTSTENGSITTEELTLMLKYMDERGVIDQSDGIDQMIIVDGHSSRMMGLFLDYVNYPKHLWSSMLGIPYDTHLWQVGDSAEMNGTFKISMTKRKRWLRQQKADFGLKQTIEKTYIILLLTLAWVEIFAIVVNKKKACAERGWNPLNLALMDHDDLQVGHMTEVECAVSRAAMLAFNAGQAMVYPKTLNMEKGFQKQLLTEWWRQC